VDPIRVVTWNVHGFVGADGRRDVERTAAVLCRLGPDIVGLQEVDCRGPCRDGKDRLERLASLAGLQATAGPTLPDGNGLFGNALLTRWPVVKVARHDASVRGREPRGILTAEIVSRSRRLRLIVTHFGLRAVERRVQVRRLLDLVEADLEMPVVVMGDFNEWRGRGWTIACLDANLGATPRVRSFPSRLPVLSLDRIWVRPREILLGLTSEADGSARLASDHLPVTALLDLEQLRSPA
jgi:endonuclease/exonuclease/phosphatase family metal-dependent hydrolase